MNKLVLNIISLNILFVGCGSDNSVQSLISDSLHDADDLITHAAQSYIQLNTDGSRLVLGAGRMPQVPYVEIELDGRARWIVAAPTGSSSIWVAVLEDGRVQAFRVKDGLWIPTEIGVNNLSPLRPPVLVIEEGLRGSLLLPPDDCAPQAYPVVSKDGRMVYISENGDLVLLDGDLRNSLPINALPDARILLDEEGQGVVYTGPTSRYPHGALGDALEPSGIAVFSIIEDLLLLHKFEFSAPFVAEGLAPLWFDWDGDRRREIFVTLSEELGGSKVAVYSEDGRLIAESDATGSSFRWRHLLAYGSFSPTGLNELVCVRTPHTYGVVEFYQRIENKVVRVAEIAGYTSHVFNTRNVNLSLMGDLDGDGILEVLLMDQDRSHLTAVGHRSGGATRLWQLEIGGKATSNLTAIALDDGSQLVGVGHDGHRLRIWGP
ncbi:MAG: hypothetical protein VX294_04105 [Candidatus Latescibacterota bacterium]|nr:hypothetical protein [Candidatus Latescibacterota bacterium]